MTGPHLGRVLLLLVLVGSPAGAHHFSVGATETADTGPQETPNRPSVTPPDHAQATRTDCPDDTLDPTQPRSGAPLCGELAYHEGTPFQVTSRPDQELFAPIGTFDVRLVHAAGTRRLETCQPWCANTLTGQLYGSANTVAWQAGLSPSDRADERDRGYQRYSVDLHATHAATLAEDATGVGRADGWMVPATDQTFVAHVVDRDGHVVGPERLSGVLRQADGLHAHAVGGVCGFTPDADVAGPDSQPGCEVPFEWQADGSTGSSGACRSPTYRCSSASQAWTARVVCTAGLARCQPPSQRAPAGLPEDAHLSRHPSRQTPDTSRPGDSTLDPSVWHFVLAPTPSRCGGDREPGFAMDASGGADKPYLAHDVDVYTPPESWSGSDRLSASLDEARGQLVPLAGQAGREASQPAWQPREPEPNTQARLAGLGDTSATRSVDRSWDTCERLDTPSESRDTFDPWIDRIDAHLERARGGQRVEGSVEAPAGTGGSRARTGAYTPTGHVGWFADTDDDGRYASVDWHRQFRRAEAAGAYPLFWDMRTTQSGDVARSRGCSLHGETLTGSQTLPAAMREAGYGPRTGLVQVLGLDEPVVWEHRPTGRTVAAPLGGVFVLASQAVHALTDPVGPRSALVDGAVADAVAAAREGSGLPDREPTWLEERAPEARTHVANSSFAAQCGEPTGGFTSHWTVHRACPGPTACGNATVVTRLLLDPAPTSSAFEDHATWIRPFPGGHDAIQPDAFQVWTDVDRYVGS